MPNIKLTTLDNGLRVITDSVSAVDSVALGIWTGVGTRNEDMAHNGVAHMVEHMLFKGTPTRNTTEIVEAIENVGGHMNAYTSREVTSYHVHLLKDHVPLALEVLADMYQRSTMPDEEVERERHVILQEIGMCHDTPDDLVFDNYYEAAYPGQALGAPILGTHDKIAAMSRDVLTAYVRHFYTPSRTVISAAGNVSHEDFVQLVKSQFCDLPADQPDIYTAASYNPSELRVEKELEQSHVIVGFRGLKRTDENFHAVQALSQILGSGMSSRLFQEVREKRGLVYSIFSFISAFHDDGQFGIYAGTGPKDLPELIPVICEEVQKISEDLSEEEVERAKAQMRSGILMARESMMTRADQQAKFLLYHGEVLDIQKRIAKIDAMNAAQIREAAKLVFGSQPTISALGPLKQLEPYEKIAQRLAA